jgi:hypothetical protein
VSESVVRDGVRLHAPLLACRPVRPEDYPPERLRWYREARAESGDTGGIYPGSTYSPCEACGIEVAVGPRQQATLEVAAELGLAAHVLCLLDASERVAEGGSDATVMHLGNPFRRAGR